MIVSRIFSIQTAHNTKHFLAQGILQVCQRCGQQRKEGQASHEKRFSTPRVDMMDMPKSS